MQKLDMTPKFAISNLKEAIAKLEKSINYRHRKWNSYPEETLFNMKKIESMQRRINLYL